MRPTDVLDQAAATDPDRVALVHGQTRLTYREVRDLSCRVGHALRTHGFTVSSHGAVLAPNDTTGFVCALGLMRAGVTWVPLNPYDGIPSIGQLLHRFDAEMLFIHSTFAEHAAELRKLAPDLREVVVYDEQLEDWLADAPTTGLTGSDDPEHIAAIYPTSGTTGLPRGVMHTNRSFTFIINSLAANATDHGPPTFLAAAPLTHVSGRIALGIMAQAGTVVILHRPDPEAFLDTLEEEQVTITMLPPTVIYALTDMPGVKQRRFPALREIVYGSAPMRIDKLKRALEIFGPVLSQGYGQTESPMLISRLNAEEHFVDGNFAPDERLRSVGKPTGVATVAILDDDGNETPQGTHGEICVRGGFVMAGYYNDPAGTEAVSAHGWHHTGDIGYFDAEGYLHIVDRKKDMIISGGFNVYPAEIERLLATHPAIAEVAVVGIPDDRWGEAVKAIVVPRAGHTVDEQEIIGLARAELGAVKAPKSVDVWESLPRNATGKVQKREIRAHYHLQQQPT